VADFFFGGFLVLVFVLVGVVTMWYVVARSWLGVATAGWASGAWLTGFRCTGRAGCLPAQVSKPSAYPGR
jgi:hypothetical protein